MESALQLPEVLSNIILHSDNKTRTAAARTSKLWSDAALDIIWKHLDSVVPLLKLLSPLKRIPYPTMWELEHLPPVEAWERFQAYAPRVRTLTYHDEYTIEGREHAHLSFNPFMDMAAMGATPLLPNLHELEWHAVRVDTPFSLVFLFLSPNLRRLCLEIDIVDIPAASFNNLLQHIPHRAPLLQKFSLYTYAPPRDIQVGLAACISKLKSLQMVGLPFGYHTDVIVNALAVAPALREMRTGWLANATPTADDSQVEFRDGWFRTLERIDFEANPSRAIQLISSQFRPTNLTRLRLTTGVISDREQLERFLAVVSATIPNITLLSLNLWGPHTPVPTPLLFSSFRPLLSCKKLTFFEVGHNHPMQLDEASITEMAEAWLELEELTICEDPVVSQDTPPGLPLSILPLFAEKFPNLKELGLFLDGTPVAPFTSPPPFKNLSELNVGTSRLEPRNVTTVALYLNDLCNLPVAIIKGKSAWHSSGVWELEEEDTPYLPSGTAWSEVNRTLKSMYQHRQEKEKARADAVQHQLHPTTELVKSPQTSLEDKVRELEAALQRLKAEGSDTKTSS